MSAEMLAFYQTGATLVERNIVSLRWIIERVEGNDNAVSLLEGYLSMETRLLDYYKEQITRWTAQQKKSSNP